MHFVYFIILNANVCLQYVQSSLLHDPGNPINTVLVKECLPIVDKNVVSKATYFVVIVDVNLILPIRIAIFILMSLYMRMFLKILLALPRLTLDKAS